jgi:NAD(P)-dependent dehydrogenase (short-subunit alcohol dehydrogenase family)
VRAEFEAQDLKAIAVPCHVGDDEDLKQLVEATVKAYGRIDILVANAAVNPVFAPLQELTPEVWAKVLNTNLTSTWRLSQLVLPVMADQGGGSMVIVSSIASLVGAPMEGAYAVSKAGLNHLARQLALEWAPKNIRVNTVVPGPTQTDMLRTYLAQEGAMETVLRLIPLGRLGSPDEVASTVLFLASEAARHVTGQHLVVDGGQTLTARTT